MSQDGHHKWVVLTITVLIAIIGFGVSIGFGAFFLALLDVYGESRSVTALVQSLLIGSLLIFGIISGSIVSKIGIARTAGLGAILSSGGFIVSFFATSIIYLCFSVGLVAGFGISLLFISSTAAIGNCFDGIQKVIAVTLQTTGISVGGIIFPLFNEWLLSIYGLHGTFLIIGGISLNLIVSAIIFAYADDGSRRQNSPAADETNIQKTNVDNNDSPGKLGKLKAHLSEWITVPYLFVLAGASINNASLNGIINIILDIFVWKGFTSNQGVASFTVFNVTGLVIRLVPGLMKRFVSRTNSCVPPIVFSLIGTAGVVVMLLGNTYVLMMLGCALVGIPFGGVIASSTILIVKMSPVKHLAVAIGLVMTASGIGSSLIGPFFGALYDASSSYTVVLIVVGGCQIFSSLLFMMALRSRHSASRETGKDQEMPVSVNTRL